MPENNRIYKKGKVFYYFLDKDILKLKLKDSTVVTIIPLCLVPYVLAYYHMQTHGGGKKLAATIQT
jgi:hypothetical protein